MNKPPAVATTDIVELNPAFLFRWEEAQQAYVLLYPEGVVKLNATAAAILKLCDGSRTAQRISAELGDTYAADVTQSVYRFLEASHAKGWIRRKS